MKPPIYHIDTACAAPSLRHFETRQGLLSLSGRLVLGPPQFAPKTTDVTMSSPYSPDPFAFDLYRQWEGTEHAVETPNGAMHEASDGDISSQQGTQRQVDKLGFCEFADWDSERTHDESK